MMDTLPGDILGEIFGQIDDLIDVYHFAAVSRRFRATYLKIRASMLSLYALETHYNNKIREDIGIYIKNYEFIICLNVDSSKVHDRKKVDYYQYKPINWRWCGYITMDFSVNLNGINKIDITDHFNKLRWHIYHGPEGNRVGLKPTPQCRFKSLYNTFLKDAKIDEQFKNIFLKVFE